jgi:phage N-6-adenine-methyltransferase
MNKVHFSSENREWETPDSVFRPLQKEFNITLDTCASAENAKTKVFITRQMNGLKVEWGSMLKAGESCWMNPPYGRSIEQWAQKAYNESLKGVTTVALLPARTDTNWFHKHIHDRGFEIRFLRGRIKFVDADSSAPFPSMIVIFKQAVETQKTKKTIWKRLWS